MPYKALAECGMNGPECGGGSAWRQQNVMFIIPSFYVFRADVLAILEL